MAQAVYRTSSGSVEKMLANIWGTSIQAAQNAAAYATQMMNCNRNACLTRSPLPAPKLKLMMGCAPWQSPCTGMLSSWVALVMMVIAPTAISPP